MPKDIVWDEIVTTELSPLIVGDSSKSWWLSKFRFLLSNVLSDWLLWSSIKSFRSIKEKLSLVMNENAQLKQKISDLENSLATAIQQVEYLKFRLWLLEEISNVVPNAWLIAFDAKTWLVVFANDSTKGLFKNRIWKDIIEWQSSVSLLKIDLKLLSDWAKFDLWDNLIFSINSTNIEGRDIFIWYFIDKTKSVEEIKNLDSLRDMIYSQYRIIEGIFYSLLKFRIL